MRILDIQCASDYCADDEKQQEDRDSNVNGGVPGDIEISEHIVRIDCVRHEGCSTSESGQMSAETVDQICRRLVSNLFKWNETHLR